MKAERLARLRGFYNSNVYIAMVAGLILLAHTTIFVGGRALLGGYQEFLFGGILFVFLMIGCFVCNDLNFFIMPLISLIFIVPVEHSPNVPDHSRFYIQPLPLTLLIVMGTLLIAGMVWFCVRNRANAAPIRWKDPVFVSMLILCGALFCNGAFSSFYTLSDTVFPVSFLLSLPAVYLLFRAYGRFDRGAGDRFMRCLVATGLLICAELLLAFLMGGVRFDDGGVVKESVLLGWGVWTAIGGMLAMLMPACFYFAHSHRYGWAFYMLGALEYLCILLCQARGGLLVGSAVLGICAIALCVSGKNRRTNRILLGIACILGVVVLVLFREKVMGIFRNFLRDGFNDNDRFGLWAKGWKNFTRYPIFGAGFYNSLIIEDWPKEVYPYLYHNTLVQMLGSGGLVAFCAYAYHRFCTIRLAIRTRNAQKNFLAVGVAALLTISLIDVLFFNTYPTIIYSLMLLFAAESDAVNDAKRL